MKKTIIYILLCFAIGASNNADAYFCTDTNFIAPVAYYAGDSLPTRIGHVNPVSTLAAVSFIAAPISYYLLSTNFFNDYYFGIVLTGSLFILGFIGGLIGFIVRKKLIAGKYTNYPEPRKLSLGKGRSAIGVFGPVVLYILLLLFAPFR